MSLADDASIARLDATGLAELVRNGEVSPTELIERSIELTERFDPDINAVIHPAFDKGRATAAGDLPDGPFRGVPMLIKDLWPASAGDPFHLGVKGLKDAGYRHPGDSHIVTRYRDAGFVLFGRTNTPELGLAATTEPLAFGPTRNPWNLDHGAGGSSGGSAAAVAAGILPAANASDGGGSIRIPAAMTGLVGLKPSRGRVPMGPLNEEWSASTQHVVCHTMRDAANILDVTAIPTLGDGVVAPSVGRPFAEFLDLDIGQLRVGILTHSNRLEVHPECVEATTTTARQLEALGHIVEPAFPAALHDPDLPSSFPAIWASSTAHTLNRIGEWLGREVTADDVEPGTWMMAQVAKTISGVDLQAAQSGQARFRRAVTAWWEDFDLLLTPTTAEPPPKIGQLCSTPGDPMGASKGSIPYAVFTAPFNVSGQPAISLPVHRTTDGLPVGAQLVGAYGREDLLLAVGAQLETAIDWASQRSPMHP